MSPIVVFYIVLVLWTVFLASSATSLKGKDVEKETVYELTDKLSWVVGGILLAFIPLWWKWITYSYVGAILVPVGGLIVTGGLAQLVLGEILSTRSVAALIRRLVILGVFILLVIWVIRLFIK